MSVKVTPKQQCGVSYSCFSLDPEKPSGVEENGSNT